MPEIIRVHHERIRAFYNRRNVELNWAAQHYRKILAHYFSHLIPADASVLEIGCGSGELLKLLPNRDVVGVDLSEKQIERARKNVPHGEFHVMAGEGLALNREFDYILISDTFNLAADVQALLEAALSVAKPDTRLVANFHNTLWRPLLSGARRTGAMLKHPASNWLSLDDVRSLMRLGGWEIVKSEHRILFPLKIPGVERFFNALLAPLAPFLNLSIFTVSRPVRQPVPEEPPSVTVVVPARNEAGNIEAAVRRTPQMGKWTEILFIEGGSSDDTWDEIQRVEQAFAEHRVRSMKQTGKGKGNAVREAFAAAEGDVLMILDADLTMPPEELPKYYEALVHKRGEMINGVRLVYPMEDQAMRFLNMCGNKFFSLLFSWLLAQPVKDTLCGTKVLYKRDYEKIRDNRGYFGNFDPFGDFDLLFGAARLNLKIVDLPIRYRNRTYGDTNISRFRHGALLFRMAGYACRKLKFI